MLFLHTFCNCRPIWKHGNEQRVLLIHISLHCVTIFVWFKSSKKSKLFITSLKCEFLYIGYRFLRSVAYRQFVYPVWEYVGASKWLPLPWCMYNAICAAFPTDAEQYHGYEEEEEGWLFLLSVKKPDSNSKGKDLFLYFLITLLKR